VGFRSAQGEQMVLEQNMFIEAVLPGLMQRQLSVDEMDHYRAPFANAGENRRPTLSWPRNIPIDGQPAEVVSVVAVSIKSKSGIALIHLVRHSIRGGALQGP